MQPSSSDPSGQSRLPSQRCDVDTMMFWDNDNDNERSNYRHTGLDRQPKPNPWQSETFGGMSEPADINLHTGESSSHSQDTQT